MEGNPQGSEPVPEADRAPLMQAPDGAPSSQAEGDEEKPELQRAPPGYIDGEDPESPKAKSAEEVNSLGPSPDPPFRTDIAEDGQDPLPPVPPPPDDAPRQSNFSKLSAARTSVVLPTVRQANCCRRACKKPKVDVIEVLKALPENHCRTLAARPWAYLLAWVIVLLVVIPLAWTPVEFDTDIEAFRRADGPAASTHSAFTASLGSMRAVKNEAALDQRKTFKVELLYEAKQGSVFSEAVQRDIRIFENQLKELTGWKDMCSSSEPLVQFRCDPGESLGNYVWPRRIDLFLNDAGYFRLAFDGSARERLPMDAVLTYLGEGLASPHNLWNFLPMAVLGTSSSSSLMRSVFTFTAPSLDSSDFEQKFKDFVKADLYNVLQEAVAKTRKPVDPTSWDKPFDIKIYFYGDAVDDYEVQLALWGDMLLAIGPLMLSLAVAWIKFRSGFLAFIATAILCLSAILAYEVLPVEKVSPASFLGVFLIFGFGMSSLFRAQELWRRSRLDATAIPERIHSLYEAAAREMLPVVTSGCCYFLLATSKLKPLREFGVFMGTSMVSVCALSIFIFVPVLILHERSIRPWLQKKCKPKLLLVLEPAEVKPKWGLVAEKLMQSTNERKRVLAGTGLAVFICFIASFSLAAVRPGPGLPEVFPPDHHKDAGRPLIKGFAPSYLAEEPAPLNTRMCTPTSIQDENNTCGLHWCDRQTTGAETEGELELDAYPANEVNPCKCYSRLPEGKTQRCSNLTLGFVMAGSRAVTTPEADVMGAVETFVRGTWQNVDHYEATGSRKRIQSLVLEDWESGSTHVDPMAELPKVHMGFKAQDSPYSTETCDEKVYCYCSPKACLRPDGYGEEDKKITLPIQDDDTAAASLDGGTPSTDVVIVFGINRVEGEMGLLDQSAPWSFDATFDPVSPWSQRAMLKACTNMPEELKIVSSSCWIVQFRLWLLRQGQKFPVERFLDFQQILQDFMVTHPSVASAMWLDKDDKLSATMFTFQVELEEGTKKNLAARQRWMDFIEKLNEEATSTANKAMVTSKVWVDNEALDAALDSAWEVLLGVSAVLLATALLYTLDLKMVLLMLLVGFCICTFISFFLFCLCGWAFGPWELTIMTVFLSYSVEPAFHICHDFVRPGMIERFKALRKMMAAEDEEGEAPSLAIANAPAPVAAITNGSSAAASQEVTQLASMEPMAQEPSTTPSHSDSLSQASDVRPKADDSLEDALKRSLHLVCKNLLVNSVKLILCGIMLLPCQFRLFNRLGAISVVLPLICVPSVLVLLPSLILAFKRTRRDPDLFQFGEIFIAKTSWMWS